MSEPIDWLAVCHGAAHAAASALASHDDHSRKSSRGAGGDVSLEIDLAAEEAILGELEATGAGLTVITEERGELELNGGGALRVVVDPIDGSRNAARGLAPYCLSIAVAEGETMADVSFGFLHDLSSGEDWWAERGAGAFLDGARLGPLEAGEIELLALEMAEPGRVEAAAARIAGTGAGRLRAIGSLALSLCWIAAGRFDGLLALSGARSVDVAAAQLVLREAGGSVSFPDAGDGDLTAGLGLDMRSRVAAARDEESLARLLAVDP